MGGDRAVISSTPLVPLSKFSHSPFMVTMLGFAEDAPSFIPLLNPWVFGRGRQSKGQEF